METFTRLTTATRHFTPYGLAPVAIVILALVAAWALPRPEALVAVTNSVPVESSAPVEPAAHAPTGVPDAGAVFAGWFPVPEVAAPTF